MHLLLRLILIGLTGSAGIVCPTGGLLFEGVCYKYHTDYKTWDGARQYCQYNYHGDLVEANSASLYQMLQRVYIDHGSNAFWLGAADQDHIGHFAWINGSPCCDPHWLPGEPNNAFNREYCVSIGGGDTLDSIGYNDYNCRYGQWFLCRTEACHVDHCMTGHVQCTGTRPENQTCLLCETGYYWDTTSHSCGGCSVNHCVAGHAQCTGPRPQDRRCSQCDVGYYWSTTSQTCTDCSAIGHVVDGYEQCKEHMSQTICSQCELCAVGSFWNTEIQTCEACTMVGCVQGHLQCNQTDQHCSQCEAGYYFNGSSCKGCTPIERCKQITCTNGFNSVCLQCMEHNIIIYNGSVCFFTEPAHNRLASTNTVIFENKVTWDTAKTICEARGEHLFVPTDDNENYKLYIDIESTADRRASIWIGGRLATDDNHVQWVNNLTSTANSWANATHQTRGGTCVALDPGQGFKWTVENCSNEGYFVCEETHSFELVG